MTRNALFSLPFVLACLLIWSILLMPYFYGFERLWDKIFGVPNLSPILFSNLERSSKPHDALFCPDGLCDDQRDGAPPVFHLSASKLKQNAHRFFIHPSNENKSFTIDPLYTIYVVRSRFFKFPDIIHVKILPLNDNTSTFALYSKSHIGYSDLGVNKKRLLTLIKTLHQSIHAN